ncbi:MAG: DsbA family protein [Bdellovibrionaceae bacterium]|nr:DsbA family protein [Pseudobdellovibrionaceae bacterium]
MKNSYIIALVIGSCIITFIASVIFAMNMVTITPKQLAKVVKKDPKTFFMALEESHKDFQKVKAESEQKEAVKALEEQFKNPLKIKTKGRVTFGNKKAPVTIVKFSDFQCTYCARAAKSMSALRDKYDGKVNLVYKNFPLSFHPFAKPAAEYFEAVALVDDDKARQFHDEIFENFDDYARLQDKESIDKAIKKILKKLNLSTKKVNKKLDKAKKVVQADMDEAMKLGVRGTPSFFVNGVDAKNIGIEQIITRVLDNDDNNDDEDEEDDDSEDT